jgi:hypothetical protein
MKVLRYKNFHEKPGENKYLSFLASLANIQPLSVFFTPRNSREKNTELKICMRLKKIVKAWTD